MEERVITGRNTDTKTDIYWRKDEQIDGQTETDRQIHIRTDKHADTQADG